MVSSLSLDLETLTLLMNFLSHSIGDETDENAPRWVSCCETVTWNIKLHSRALSIRSLLSFHVHVTHEFTEKILRARLSTRLGSTDNTAEFSLQHTKKLTTSTWHSTVQNVLSSTRRNNATRWRGCRVRLGMLCGSTELHC